MRKIVQLIRAGLQRLPVSGRTTVLLLGLLPLLVLFLYVGLRSGPLAPIPVTVTAVENLPVAPALFGVGTVEARRIYKIGPTTPGRVKRVLVQVGDRVRARQLVGEMEYPDLDVMVTPAEQEFLREALQDASPKNASVSRGLLLSSSNLRLRAPVNGLVISRNVEPGTTVVAGQPVVEIIDPNSLWINTRFDQVSSAGLQAGLQASIVMRSQAGTATHGRVLRVEPLADAVTEEILAKVVFDETPSPLPPLGEIAEVTLALPPLKAAPVVPNASLRRVDGRLGVWVIQNDRLRFTVVKKGAMDLTGLVQVHAGLKIGDRVVVYSRSALSARSRIQIVDRLVEPAP